MAFTHFSSLLFTCNFVRRHYRQTTATIFPHFSNGGAVSKNLRLPPPPPHDPRLLFSTA
jgi:hypothetical protein